MSWFGLLMNEIYFIKQVQTHERCCLSFMLVNTLFDLDHDSEKPWQTASGTKDVLPSTLRADGKYTCVPWVEDYGRYFNGSHYRAVMAYPLTSWKGSVCLQQITGGFGNARCAFMFLTFFLFLPVLPLPSNRYSVIRDTWPTQDLRKTVDILDQDYSSALKITRVAVCLLASWGDRGGVRCKQPAS